MYSDIKWSKFECTHFVMQGPKGFKGDVGDQGPDGPMGFKVKIENTHQTLTG